MPPLESLHRLSLTLGASLNRAHECAVFMEWLKAEVQPRLAVLFIAEPKRDSLRLTALSKRVKLPAVLLPLGHDPWGWLKEQKITCPRGERYALPIDLEEELFGLLAIVSAQKGEALNEEQRLLDLALAYLAPILRNIERYADIERLVEERTAQLRASEERFRTLAETTATAIFVYSGEKFIYANPATEELTGYSAGELLKLRFWDVVHPDFQEMIRQRGLARQRGEDVPTRYEFKIVRKDGEERWIDFTAGKIEWHGQPAAIGSAFDITERKQAEEALRASEERFRAYIERANDYIFSLDPQGNFIFVNQAMCLALGYRADELLGQPALTVVAPQARQEAAQVLQRIWAGETLDYVDLPVQTREGKTLLVQIRGRAFYRDEQLTETLHIARDITLQKQAEEKLRTEQERYRSLFEQSHDAIFILDLQGQHLAANQRAAEMLGYTLDELLALSFREISAEVQQSENALQRLLRGEHVPLYQRKFRRKSGEILDVEINVELVRDGGGNPLYIQSVVRDITERKHHERQLEAQAMLAQALGETLELQPLLERLLAAARHAIPAAEKGSILLIETDGRLKVRALNGYRDPRLQEFSFASDSGYSARTVRERRPLLIADARADPEVRYDGEIEEARQIRGAIAAPLLIQDRVIGVISLDSTQKNAFSEEDLNHLAGFAASAALIIENARLFEETQRRAGETAALLEASLSLSSLDLQETLHTIGQRAKDLFSADGCRIFLLEPDGQTLRCVLALAESEVAFDGLTIPLGQGVTGQVALSGKAEIVNDMLHDPRAVPVPGTNEEPEAIMFAPLKEGERTIGVISIRRIGTERPFQPADLNLLQAFAALAASAVSNARLFEEIEARLQKLEILQSLSAALRQAHTVNEMLPLFIQRAAQAVNAAAGSIYLWEETSGEWVSHGWMDSDGRWLTDTADLRHRPGEGVTGWVGERGEIYITTDWRADTTNQPRPHELELLQRLTSGISLPLKTEARILGILHLWYAERHTFTEDEKRLLTAIADMAGNALQRARLHEETERQLKRLLALRDIDRAIASSFDLNLVFNFLLNGVLTQLNADATDILLFDPQTNTLYRAAGRGFHTLHSPPRLRLDESLAGRAALERQVIAIPKLETSAQRFAKPDLLEGEYFKAYYAHPLIGKGELKGVLEVFFRTPFAASPDWLDFFETLAGQTAIAIDNARLFENLQRSNFELTLAYDETIEGWSRALDLRDKETEGHTQRVTELTLKLAHAMSIPLADLVHIRRGALLHDIGKMGVPDYILFKEGPLTPEEWAIMRRHPQFAYEMLAPIQFLRPALDIPYCHHEKWDGSGYPRGLKGEEIPLAARIFAVADVFDALTSDRPYRAAWSKEKTLEYIREQAGKHFDPQVVSVFLRLIEAGE
ncbi:MAG: hypothetical protein Kow0070_30890 [Anaerolineales bacterium]